MKSDKGLSAVPHDLVDVSQLSISPKVEKMLAFLRGEGLDFCRVELRSEQDVFRFATEAALLGARWVRDPRTFRFTRVMLSRSDEDLMNCLDEYCGEVRIGWEPVIHFRSGESRVIAQDDYSRLIPPGTRNELAPIVGDEGLRAVAIVSFTADDDAPYVDWDLLGGQLIACDEGDNIYFKTRTGTFRSKFLLTLG